MSQRITITFSDSEFLKLQKTAIEKEISLTEYIRSLVNIGRQVKTTLEASCGEKKTTDLVSTLTALWKNNLLCVFESPYLTRYLLDQLVQDSPEKKCCIEDD